MYPSCKFCTPAQIFVPQVIKVYPKKYRELLGYLLDKLKFLELINADSLFLHKPHTPNYRKGS